MDVKSSCSTDKKNTLPVFDLEKRVYTINELMEILEISRSGTYNLVERNDFHSVRAAGCIRISKRSFDAWLKAQNGMKVKDADAAGDKLHRRFSGV